MNNPFADLGPRLLSGFVLVVTALASTWVGGVWFAVFCSLAAIAILVEWQGIILESPLSVGSLIGLVALILVAFLTCGNLVPWALLAIIVAAALMAGTAAPIRRVWSGFSVVYAGSLLISLLILRNASHAGREAILWLCATAWGHDIAAYFGGRLIGGPKLWPRVSPSKTWAGTLLGILVGGLAGTIVALSVAPSTSLRIMLIDVSLGLAAAAAVQMGDLFESGFKRLFGVKDSGHLIPGHGGFMDRLDGFLAAAVFATIVGVGRGGMQSAAEGLFYW